MYDDVIFYHDGIQKTLQFARELGSKKILVVFEKHSKENKIDGVATALLVRSLKDAKFSSFYDELVGVSSREFVEHKQIKYLFGAEGLEKKDKLHYRNSGLNQVECKLMVKLQKVYLFSLDLLFSDRVLIMGRMKQNMRYFRKYGVDCSCVSFANNALGLRTKKERKLFLEML